MQLCVATANVRTLLPHQDKCSYANVTGVLMLSKVQILEQQFYDAGIHVIGVQEGRAPVSQERVGHSYRMLIAAADQSGSYGVQLWVKLDVSVRLWREVGPRLLYAVVRRSGVEVGFVVGHAPHESAACKSKDEWWQLLDTTLTMLTAKYHVSWSLLLDANARTGSILSHAIGTSMASKENDNGARLRVLAEAHGLVLANTFGEGAGPTWTSTRNTHWRIDYVCLPRDVFLGMSSCKVDRTIDLSLNASDDHLAVVATATFIPRSPLALEEKAFRVNKLNLGNPCMLQVFQRLMWEFPVVPACLHIDDHLERLNVYVKWAAKISFGSHKDRPRKKWISADTWVLIKLVAPLRRSRHESLLLERSHFLAFCFCAWRCASVQPLPSASVQQVHGASDQQLTAAVVSPEVCRLRADSRSPWFLQGAAVDADVGVCKWRWLGARISSTIFRVQAAARPMLERDRTDFLDGLALQASLAMNNGDSRSSFAIVRSLGGRAIKFNSSIKKLDGTLAATPGDVSLRWQEHFAEVFCGDVVDKTSLREHDTAACTFQSTLDVGAEATSRAFRSLGRNKGVGLDDIPAELLQAGSDAIACKFADVNVRVLGNGAWPTQWRGGRMVDVYKKKGDASDCNSSRGILLADHSGKALTGIVKNAIDPFYEHHMPPTQFGAVKHRGTDMATHLIRSAIDTAKLLELSIFVLFVDLVKAFDKVIRQLVFGWGSSKPEDPVSFLCTLGVERVSAQWICDYIDERGHLLQQWGVDPGAACLSQALHHGAWFCIADLDSAVLSKTGGRQGCKLGALTFNSVYAVALDMLAWELRRADIVFRVRVPDGAFWQRSDEDVDASDDNVVDAAFVDDEAIVLMAKSPALLDRAIDITLKAVFRIFSLLHLQINLAEGKTECFLSYRGKHAVAKREARRGPDGKLRIDVPGIHGLAVSVVGVYKHLGTFCSQSGDTFRNSLLRTQSAMASYSPIASKVFGADSIPQAHKLIFLSSLILSRLLFAVYVTVPSARDLTALNAVYMRALRRIVGHSRFSEDVELTDVKVRTLAKKPSLDCLIARMRLAYAGRLARLRPRALLGLLHTIKGDRRLPWVEALARDAEKLRELGLTPPGFPHFFEAPCDWHRIMLDEKRWRELVDRLFFLDSACDRVRTEHATSTLTFQCLSCTACFATKRALASHSRAKHHSRAVIRSFVRSSVCPCCKTDFREKIRCLAHLSDIRRAKCHEWIIMNCMPMNSTELASLDLELREQRRAAQRSGKSHHIACGPAKRADGTTIGRVFT